MKITKLATQERNVDRVNMFLEGKFSCGVSLNTVAKFNLFVGKELSEDEFNKILQDDLKERIFNRAVTYISRAIKSEKQIRMYLNNLLFKKKGVWFEDLSKASSSEIVSVVIEKLKSYSYINDEEFAVQFVLSRIKSKPRGKYVLVSELISKGISKDLAEQKVNELVEDEFDILKRVFEKKYGECKLSKKDRKKIDFLHRKGFDWDLIERLINNESEE